MKRLVLVCVLLALLGSALVACGPGALGSRPDPVTLRFAYRAGTMQVEALLDDFRAEHPHITVEAVEVARWGGDMGQRVAQGQVDLFRDSREALAMAERGLIRPLDDVHLAEWSGIRDDYYRGIWESLAIGGQQWGVPAGLDTMVLYANMDAVRLLGVTLPGAGEPYDAFRFLELANALNHPEGSPQLLGARLYGFCSDPEQWDPFFFVYLWGGRLVDDLNDPQRPTLDQNETIEALRWYVDLFTRYGVAPTPAVVRSSFAGGVNQAQVNGGCGLWLGLYSSRGGLDTQFRWTADWEMLPLPRAGGAWSMADVEGYYVTGSSQHPNEALLLARFLSDRAEAAGSLVPARRSLTADPAYERAVGAAVAEQARGLSDQLIIVPTELSPQLMAAGEAVLRAVNQSIQQGMDIEPLLLEAQQQLQRGF
jgi:ABC-type glycerol-3-phosphate transport system substrate-binding protein